MHSTRTLIATIIFGLLFSFTAFAFTYNPTTSFTRDLKLGMKGDDVKELQIFLNNNGFTVSSTDSGSIGKESVYFGKKTKEAVIKFQETYKTDILEPLSLKNGTGLFYKATRDFINKSIISTPVITVFIPQTTSTTSTVVNIPQVTPTSTQQEITITPTLSVSKTYTIIYTAENGGSIKGSSTQIIKENATGTEVTAVADSGYYFIDWSDGVTSSTRTDSNLTENKNVNANFGYRRRMPAKTITISEINGVTAPVKLAIQATTITETDEYTGTITWSPDNGRFNPDTSYTATIRLSPKLGYKLSGITENFFTISGATTTNNANSGIIIAEFPKTELFDTDDLVTFTYNGSEVTYGVVQNSTTSKIWLDRNLGATQVATAYNDELAYGDLFQWGRGDDGHQLRTSGTTGVLSDTDTPGHANFIVISSNPYDWRSPQNTNLWQGVNGINNPCPIGFRVPTNTELDTERTSWISDNSAGAFASPLKFTVNGYRYPLDGSFNETGSSGHYWSSNVLSDSILSRELHFTVDSALINNYYHAGGHAVRCIKD